MAVISSIPMVIVTHFGALETLGTVLLCYTLAVSLGHVPAWLPMISDCAVQPPEKYPFRLGLVVSSMVLGLNTVVVYYSDRAFSKSKLCLILGTVASAGLSIVAVVNEKENNTVHSGTIRRAMWTLAIVLLCPHSCSSVILRTLRPIHDCDDRSRPPGEENLASLSCGEAGLCLCWYSLSRSACLNK